MSLQQTRRALLATGSVLTATALAGCSAVPGFGPESDSSGPDAGGGSYGLVVRNDTDESYPVTVTASARGEDPFFEETVESTPDEDREWDSVLTDEGMHVVEATVDAEHFFEEASQTQRTIVVGTENSPEVRDVLVHLQTEGPGLVVEVDLDWGQ
jgi:hypothetical protein